MDNPLNLEENNNMRIWDKVEKTDPAFTKYVNMRGGFTSIDAMYRVKLATQEWGPYGSTWGVKDLNFDYIRGPKTAKTEEGTIVLEDAILGEALTATFYYPSGEFELGTDLRPLGDDSRKKLLTDLTTKALSKLGFNADVYMGTFEDDKYEEGKDSTSKKGGTSKPQVKMF